jgi:uncharacterized protein (UPF0332 family)
MSRSEVWYKLARQGIASAERLYREGDYRGSANRSYYAAYHVATGLCYEHGDEIHFAHGWNNPSHEQLPDLIRNNGSIAIEVRRSVNQMLREMRAVREDADYRPGRTVEQTESLKSLRQCYIFLEKLGVQTND